MIELNEDQRRTIDEARDAPPRVTDPANDRIHVLLKSTDFDWLRAILADEPDAPRLTDPRTQTGYALVAVERYERFKSFFEEDPITSEERTALLRAAGLKAGWDDPAFDVYDTTHTQKRS